MIKWVKREYYYIMMRYYIRKSKSPYSAEYIMYKHYFQKWEETL